MCVLYLYLSLSLSLSLYIYIYIYICIPYLGIQTVIPTPDFRNSPGGRKY